MSTMIERAVAILVCIAALTVVALAPSAACAATDPLSNEVENSLLLALSGRVTVDFDDKPIRDVLAALMAMAPTKEKLSLAYDQRSLTEGGVKLDSKVTLQAADIRLRSALDFALGQAGAAWTIRDEMLLITTRQVADRRMMVRTYDVTDVAIRAADADRAPDVQQWIDVIKHAIAPESWDTRGGPGSIEIFRKSGYARDVYRLVVRQTPAIHFEILCLNNELRFNSPLSAAEKQLCKALDEPTVLEFVETPLSDVITYLHDLHQIDIVIDGRLVRAATFDSDQPITATLRGISLRSALRIIFDPLGLTWEIKDEVLFITRAKADDKPKAHDKLGVKDRPVRGHVLRTTPSQERPESPRRASRGTSEDATVADERLRKILNEPTSLDFTETPLIEVVEYLNDLHQIKMYVSGHEAKFNLDQPITLIRRNISLQTVLDLVFEPLDRTCWIHNGTIWIISQKEVDDMRPPAPIRWPTVEKYPLPSFIPPAENDPSE